VHGVTGFWCGAGRGADAPCYGPAARRAVNVSASKSDAFVLGAAVRARLPFGHRRRLRQRADFERLFREGARRSAGGFLFYVARRDSGPPRLGIVISRRHARLAATRNAIKRYIREAFRLEQIVLGPIDLLVRPPLGIRPSVAMMTRLRALLARLEEK